MARGGPRPGAGRPKGAKTARMDIDDDAQAAEMSPLDYMLSVMRNTKADATRRDRMAQAAAPFVHARAEAATPTRKEQAAVAAQDAASTGTFAPPSGPKLVVNNP